MDVIREVVESKPNMTTSQIQRELRNREQNKVKL